MFPGAGARIFRNDAGEVTGWDYPDSYDEPSDPFDDDGYWINAREADDYAHEGDEDE